MDTAIFYGVLFVHLVSFITAFGSVIVVDTFGLLWLLKRPGVTLELVVKVASVTQKLIWLGYTGLVLSGTFQLFAKGYVDNLTKIKIFLVLMIGLNGIFLDKIKKSMESMVATNQVTPVVKFRIGLATGISQLGWWGALVIGYYHRQIEHNVTWPEQWWLVVGFILMAIAVTAVIGEKLAKTRAMKP